MIKSILVVFCTFVTSARCWRSYNEELKGRIIRVESLQDRGNWLSADTTLDDYMAGFTGLAEGDVYYVTHSQFLVKDCGLWVCLESVNYPNYFWKVNAPNDVLYIMQTFYPNDKVNFQWRIECENPDLTICSFYNQAGTSPANPNYVCYHPVKALVTAFQNPASYFRIVAPSPSESYKIVLDTINESSLKQHKEITLSEGVSNTDSSSKTITQTVSTEIGGAFKSVSASANTMLSIEWQQTSSQTYEASKVIKYSIDIPPFSRISFKQLSGEYGPFSVNAKFFMITCNSTITHKKCTPITEEKMKISRRQRGLTFSSFCVIKKIGSKGKEKKVGSKGKEKKFRSKGKGKKAGSKGKGRKVGSKGRGGEPGSLSTIICF